MKKNIINLNLSYQKQWCTLIRLVSKWSSVCHGKSCLWQWPVCGPNKNHRIFEDIIWNAKQKHNFANHFNEFFAGVGPRRLSEISNIGTTTLSTYLKQAIKTSFIFDCVSQSAVMCVIKTIAAKQQYWDWSYFDKYVLKACPVIINHLTHTFAVHRYLPKSLKNRKVQTAI